jgi:hypothetical protein
MDLNDSTLEIMTLGRFRISVDGKPVVTEWPDDAMKVFFCSLLSPLDLYVTWDRVCRSILGVPETLSSRHHLEKTSIRPLNLFLIEELGFTPVVSEHEGIRVDRQRTHIDAFEFHSTAKEGLRLLSLGYHAAAFKKFSSAKLLYSGSYLPGITGKIIENTRNELEAFYQTTVLQANNDNVDLFINEQLPVI